MPHLVSLPAPQSYRAKRGTKAVPKGETLHYIKHQDRYFAWAYRNRDFALQMVGKLEGVITSGIDWEANWRTNHARCATSDRTGFSK